MGRTRRLDLRTAAAAVMFAGWATSSASAGSHEVDFYELLADTQQKAADPSRTTVVWWMPEEYWKAVGQLQALSQEHQAAMLSVFRPYVVLMVVDGTVGPMGGVEFRTPEQLRDAVVLVDGQGSRYGPLAEDHVSQDARTFASIIKPMMANTMGPLGESTALLFFPATTSDGSQIAVAKRKGGFSVEVGDQVFEWRTPLGSVVPRKICPVDGREMSGAWFYCPWHGEKLTPQE